MVYRSIIHGIKKKERSLTDESENLHVDFNERKCLKCPLREIIISITETKSRENNFSFAFVRSFLSN